MTVAIRCVRCDAENRAGRRFCSACGEALPQPCPDCGFVNEPMERFCGGCGAAREAALATTSAAAPLEKPSPHLSPGDLSEGLSEDFGERRQVTILFADLSGYTSLAARRDPEETHRILGRFFEAVDSAVTRFGGAIERHIGDNVMGMFGAPVAHGDDPYRAVKAAEEIHRVVTALSAEIGIALSVHIGIACGTVMAGGTGSRLKAEYGVVGSPVNLAARLQARAKAGETLISNSLWDAVENLVELESLGEVAMKGLDAPEHVWRVIAERSGRSTGAAVPLVGRRAEVRLLRSLLDGVSEQGHGRVIYVRGEAGIGKTRMLQVFAEEARARGFSCHVALILDFGTGRGRDAMRTLIAGLLGSAPDAPEGERRACAQSAIARGLAAGDDLVFLADLLDLPQSPEDRTLYDAMDNVGRSRGNARVAAGLLRAVAATTPVVLIVEDLHWAEPATLEDLAALANAVGECPAVLAMTSRIEADPLDDAWRARVRAGVTSIDLGPLRPEEASEFGQLLRLANDALLMRCIDRAEGNPLFLEQLLRNAREGVEADEIPASVQSLVLARMDRLDPRNKAALQAASIAGQRFPLELVRALVRDPAFAPAALLRNQMIRPDGAEFLFAHALVRDGVYSSLTHERRRALHHAAADWYADRDRVLRAEHLDRANDPAAAQAYREASHAQALDYHYDRALSLVERGRAIAPTQADRFGLDALRGEYLRETGRALDSRTAFEAALAEATTALETCRALIGIAAADRILSRSEPALSALGEAQPLAEAEGLVAERAQIHYYRGNLLFAQGNTAGCLAEHQAALAAAEEVGSPEWRARALSGLGDAHYSSCKMRTALAAFQDCVALCDAHGYGRVALPNRVMIGHCMIYLQRVAEAVAIMQETRKMASRAGNPHAEMFATQSLCVVLTQSGQADEAMRHIPAALDAARALGARRYESNILCHMAECELSLGRRTEGLQAAQDAVAISREVGMGFDGPYALAVLARATDDATRRASLLAEGEAVLRKGSVGHNRVWYYRVAGDAHIESGSWRDADRCAQEIRAVTCAEPLPLVEFIAARIAALSAIGRGEREPDLRDEIDRLISQGKSKGHHSWLLALSDARNMF
jgi:class 3 adenylate cyclase/tetratricopeptide (TPR) repeat protein